MHNLKKGKFSAFVILDIDDFKIINELYGNILGNRVLIHLAKVLSDFSREKECNYGIYRLGSDEFALVCTKIYTKREFTSKMEELYGYIVAKDIELIENIKINVNVTMGVSFERNEALSKADIALNHAKEHGNKFSIYSKEIDNRLDIDKNIKIKKELIDAIENNRIVPFFQPIVDRNENIIKYEALIRMFLENKTILLPVDFLSIAKKSKLYPKLSKIMIQKSFEKFKNSNKLS